MKKGDNQLLVIFGASGDLCVRKLIPAIFDLYKEGHLAENFAVLGTSRSNLSDEQFRAKVVTESQFLADSISGEDKNFIKTFADKLFYEDLGDSYEEPFVGLSKRIQTLNSDLKLDNNIIFYLSTPPGIYELIAKNLKEQGLTDESNGWKRIIVEKPFGYSLETAKNLNKGLQKYFNESQIYRIDHYLGKETVQNLLVTRFANSIFEPLWNRNYINHIEITNAESVGVDNRGGYYDKSGALRDMFQNHLMQIVSLVAMEPPIDSQPESIRNEKVKALQSIRHLNEETFYDNTTRGQYLASTINGKKVKGYREEEGVDPNSMTETYAALKFYIDNWRWKDVPFYVRTAKCMPTKVTEVVIHFKPSHHRLFEGTNSDNRLIIRIQPDEGILMKFGVKVPGQGFKVETANLDFHYTDLVDTYVMEAYERLLLDAMQGDATLYARADEVEAAWAFVDPILKRWENNDDKMHGYPAGTWGPKFSDQLFKGNVGGDGFRNPGPNLTDSEDYCEL
ncbi:glucose-6-phosphate dehydrogenase [Aquimarina agarivorans]|uniref:glucose-6-phosphate dehydrogenase n=1 Tax=Aquimarina agarivorans TaxID=980584 RepID=UPI0002D96B71|nr:glucose-6-phosphate dehydrogenase [Aquimarina agarivorans]